MISTLLFFGMSPDQAIATNRLSNLSNIFTIIKFHQLGLVKWRIGLFLVGFVAVGAAIGSLLVVSLDTDILEKGIGVLLVLSVPLLFFQKKLGMSERIIKMTKLRSIIGGFIMMILGALGGFFSSTGVWFSYFYLLYYGLTYLQTAATRKITGSAIVLTSLIIFIPNGLVDWPSGLAMFVGGGLGGWIAAHYSVKLGNAWIRNLFAVVVLGSAIKVLFF